MTHDEALAFWYGRIDFERKSPKQGDLKLDRMRAVLRALGDPHRRFRIIHVAGTKGKGSTSAMLASVLRAAGYRVGLFTSPHLSDVSERIQVDGIPISRDEMAVRLAEIAAVVRPMDESNDSLRFPTFFEVGTALGFLHFDCRRVDVAVVEVGLGGRFDATNVCSPWATVITNISFDHMQLLGDCLAQIAREKAGIVKKGRPLVTTAEAPEALVEIEQIAAERGAHLTELGRDFHFEYTSGDRSYPTFQVTTRKRTWPWMKLGLLGQHQAANAAGVVAVVESLRDLGLPIADRAVERGLADVQWPARMEIVSRRPLIVLDCAHNVASVQALDMTVRESFPVSGCKRALLAFSNDKQVAEMLAAMESTFDEFVLTKYANSPRSLPPEQAAILLKSIRPEANVSIYPTAREALDAVRTRSTRDDLIVISGSVFLAGELRPLLVQS